MTSSACYNDSHPQIENNKSMETGFEPKTVLLETKEIGVTTYARFAVTMRSELFLKFGSPYNTYCVACNCVTNELFLERMWHGCYLCFRVKEADGNTVKSRLTPVIDKLPNRKDIIENVDLDELRRKHCSGISLIENVEQADKWLSHQSVLVSDSPPNTAIVISGENSRAKGEMEIYTRFPLEGKCDHMFLERWYAIYSIAPGEDDENTFSRMVSTACQRSCENNEIKIPFAMVEIVTPDGQRIFTKLRRHDKNMGNVISSTIKARCLDYQSLNGVSIVGIYVVDIPLFATTKQRAQSRLDFIRRNLLIPTQAYDQVQMRRKAPLQKIAAVAKEIVPLNECTEQLVSNCKCKKLHLSDYCIIRSSFQKKHDCMMTGRWTISPLDIFFKMAKHFSAVDVAGQLYAFIAYRLAPNTFSESLEVGTNIFYEVVVEDKSYASPLAHHFEFNPDMMAVNMFKDSKFIKMCKEIVVNVYLVNILDFATNEEAHDGISAFLFLMKTKTQFEDPNTPKYEPARQADYFISLDIKYFVFQSPLSLQTLFVPISIIAAYRIMFTKAKINTTKDRILLFGVEVDQQFSKDVKDYPLLLANICLDITKVNELFLWAEKKKKITLSSQSYSVKILSWKLL